MKQIIKKQTGDKQKMSQDEKALKKDTNQENLAENESSETIFLKGSLEMLNPGVYLFTQG